MNLRRVLPLASGIALAGLLVLGVCATAWAQTTVGGIRGVVKDASGAVVPGAAVVAKNAATGLEYRSVTGTEGIYTIPRIPPGNYVLTIEVAGFKKSEHPNVEIGIGKDTVVDAVLETGGTTETVTVEATGSALVQSDTVQISTNFEAKKVQDLPINVPGGGLDRIALLVPGVAPGFGNVNSNGVTLSANGQRARSNNFTIDGVDNNDLSIGGPNYFVQNASAVAEFQVITNNFSAEYGRNQGAIVNIVSRTGGNGYHGTVSWFHRDRKNWDSLTNIERRTGQLNPAPDLFNLFSYGVGGPIIRNRAFFFTSGQWIRNPRIIDQRTTSMAPTTAGMSTLKSAFPNNAAVQYFADYSAFGLPLGNPTPRPDVAQSTMTVGSTTVPVAAVQRLTPVANDSRENTVRGDARLSDKDSIWGRYFFQTQPNINAGVNVGGWVYDNPVQSQQAGGGWTRTLTPRAVNELRFNYSRLFVIFGGGSTGGKGQIPHPDQIDKALAFLNPNFTAASGNPLLSIGPATNLPQGRTVEAFQASDNFSLTRGRHQMKFGVDFRRLRNNVPFLPNVNGAYTFANGTQLSTNTPDSLVVALGPATLEYFENDHFYYFQDDWRIRDNFTLNLGLRYENTGQPINLLNEVTAARENDAAKAFWRKDLPADARVVNAIPTDSNNWAPRFGFVYTPKFREGLLGRLFGANKTIFSGGFGMAYDPAFYNLMLNISTSAPTVFLTTVAGVAVPVNVPTGDKVRDAAVASGLIAYNTFDPRFLSRTTVSPSFRSPYSEQWSFRWQREFARDKVAEVRYVGTHGVGLFQTINANPFVGNLLNGFSRTALVDSAAGDLRTINFPGFPSLLPSGTRALTCVDNPSTRDNESACNGRIYPWGLARERINGAQSIYHGLQSRFDTRFGRHLISGLTYTWSHTIDNSSEVFSFNGGNSVAVAQNPLSLTKAERGNSGFDNRHVFTAHWIWETPWFSGQHGVLGKIAGGWQVNGVVRIQTERLFTPLHRLASLNPYEDSAYMAGFFGSGSHFRPFSGNSSQPLDRVGITDIDACVFYSLCGASGGVPILRQSTSGYYLMSDLNATPRTFTPVTPNDVRFIINGPGAALRFGTPFGNVMRNAFPGDRIEAVDLSFFKTTKVTERVSVQYRFEMYNALNHPTFGIPNSITIDNRFYMNYQENSGGRRNLAMSLHIVF
jgi:outer membrane receptor protein involved in Fe transport